jgi:hypothetical protein
MLTFESAAVQGVTSIVEKLTVSRKYYTPMSEPRGCGGHGGEGVEAGEERGGESKPG